MTDAYVAIYELTIPGNIAPGELFETVVDVSARSWGGTTDLEHENGRFQVNFRAIVAGELILCESVHPTIVRTDSRMLLYMAVRAAPLGKTTIVEGVTGNINAIVNSPPLPSIQTGHDAADAFDGFKHSLITFGPPEPDPDVLTPEGEPMLRISMIPAFPDEWRARWGHP